MARFVSDRLKGRTALCVLGVAAIVSLAVVLLFLIKRPGEEVTYAIGPEITGMDTKTLSKQIRFAESRLERLKERRAHLFPLSAVILVDSGENQIYLVQSSHVVIQDKCSTGTGFELTEPSGKRTWTFDTPRGYFAVLGKISDPVWYRPDWAFIEEGEPIPKDRARRAVPNVLGDYAIAFGDGYFIHGTLYTRTLGTSVTHGCIRVDDDTLKKLYQAARPGTPIWIY